MTAYDRQAPSLTNLLLWSMVILATSMVGLEELEDLVRWPPQFDSLTVYKGNLSRVWPCKFRRFSGSGFDATLENPGGEKITIRLPCIRAVEALPIGTPLIVHGQPRFGREARIWEISSGNRVYLSFKRTYAYEADQQSFHLVFMIVCFAFAGFVGWKMKVAFSNRKAPPIEMGHPFKIRVSGLDPAARQVAFETQRTRDAPAQKQVVTLPQPELLGLQAVLVSRPFGEASHEYVLESITQSNGAYECLVRISAEGKRERSRLAISAETYGELKKVFDSNIVS